MSTTHIGKIGRLTQSIRQILGERIVDGIPNKELVEWLNGLKPVKEVLALRFGGRAITEQNLSEWKQGGHVEWLRREERRGLALRRLEQREAEAMEPEEAQAEKEVSDRLGRELGMEMAGLALVLVEQEGDAESRWKRLCTLYREVSQLRRDDHRAEGMRIKRERWEHELAVAEAAAEKQARKEESLNLFSGLATQLNLKIMEQALRGTSVRPPGGTGVRPPKAVARMEGACARPLGTVARIEDGGSRMAGTGEPRTEGDRLKAGLQTFESGESQPAADTGEIRPNPSKSNRQGTSVRPPGGTDVRPLGTAARIEDGGSRMAGTGESRTEGDRLKAELQTVESGESQPAADAGEIRPNTTKPYRNFVEEAWLKAMNSV